MNAPDAEQIAWTVKVWVASPMFEADAIHPSSRLASPSGPSKGSDVFTRMKGLVLASVTCTPPPVTEVPAGHGTFLTTRVPSVAVAETYR